MAIMTVAAIDTDVGATHPGRRSFLWMAALTALWVILNYWQPGIQASGVPNTASRVSIHVLVALGLWLGLEKTALSMSQRRNVWLAVMVPCTLWLSVIWNMAIYGVFRPGSGLPLLPLTIFLPVIIGAPILLRSKRMGEVLDAMPASW